MLLKPKHFFSGKKFPWHRPLIWMVYSSLIAFLVVELGYKIQVPIAVTGIVGTAVSLFLGFRTNSAYQRWWEARKIWGAIINNSRTLARQVLLFGTDGADQEIRTRIIHRHIAWNWLLASTLRQVGESKEAKAYLSPEETAWLQSSSNGPNLLLLQQEKDLKQMVNNGSMDDFFFRKIDSSLKELCDSMGKCERIKKTVFPTQYALFNLIFINIFLLLLPLSIALPLGYFSIPIVFVVGYTFAMIQNIAASMQDPFDNQPNDTPMFAISRTIERNLLEMMGHQELPETYKAVNGVLM